MHEGLQVEVEILGRGLLAHESLDEAARYCRAAVDLRTHDLAHVALLYLHGQVLLPARLAERVLARYLHKVRDGQLMSCRRRRIRLVLVILAAARAAVEANVAFHDDIVIGGSRRCRCGGGGLRRAIGERRRRARRCRATLGRCHVGGRGRSSLANSLLASRCRIVERDRLELKALLVRLRLGRDYVRHRLLLMLLDYSGRKTARLAALDRIVEPRVEQALLGPRFFVCLIKIKVALNLDMCFFLLLFKDRFTMLFE